jgi:hypothetical protein
MMQRWIGAEVCASKQAGLTPALHPVNKRVTSRLACAEAIRYI